MYNNTDRNRLIHSANTYSYALSLLNIDMLCRQLGCAYYDYRHHGIVLLLINPIIGRNNDVISLTQIMHRQATIILAYQNNKYSFIKDRFEYINENWYQAEFIGYIKRCHNYTMNCYKLDGIL